MTRPVTSNPISSGFVWRMALFFAALFLIYGVHVSYLPLWLHWRGLSPAEIGTITALPIFLRVVLTPMIAAHADATREHRRLIVGLSVLALGLGCSMLLGSGYGFLLITAVPYSIAVASMMPLTETIAVSGVRAAGYDYGRMRLWGSLAFLVATIAAGRATDLYGPSVAIFVLLAATLVTVGAALLLPEPMSSSVATGAAPGLEGEAGLTLELAGHPLFGVFLFAVGAILSSHAAFYTFGALHLAGLGISGQAFGILWAVSIVAEMVLLAFSGAILVRVTPLQLIMLAGAGGCVRWGGMSVDPPFGLMLVLQALHGLTYGATHLGAIHFMARAVPGRGAGTAQGLYSAIGAGLFTGVATLACGHLYPQLLGQTFLVMAGVCAAGLLAAIWLAKVWDGEPLIETAAVSPIVPVTPA